MFQLSSGWVAQLLRMYSRYTKLVGFIRIQGTQKSTSECISRWNNRSVSLKSVFLKQMFHLNKPQNANSVLKLNYPSPAYVFAKYVFAKSCRKGGKKYNFESKNLCVPICRILEGNIPRSLVLGSNNLLRILVTGPYISEIHQI